MSPSTALVTFGLNPPPRRSARMFLCIPSFETEDNNAGITYCTVRTAAPLEAQNSSAGNGTSTNECHEPCQRSKQERMCVALPAVDIQLLPLKTRFTCRAQLRMPTHRYPSLSFLDAWFTLVNGELSKKDNALQRYTAPFRSV